MSEPALMTCRELIDFIADYLDGSLPPGPRGEFERHLGLCPSCVNYLDGYRRAMTLGRAALAASDAPATSLAPEDFVRAVRAARRHSAG